MNEWRCVPVQLCAYPSISGQGLPVPGQMCVFQLAEGQGRAGGGGRFCISGDKECGCISHTRSVGHRQVTARTGCQVWACRRFMVAPLRRDRGLLAAASSAPSSPCVDACSQSSKGNPATLFIFYNCCFCSPPSPFHFFSFPTEVLKNVSLSAQCLPFPSHCSLRGGPF